MRHSQPAPHRAAFGTLAWGVLLALPLGAFACGEDCVEVSADCAPGYEPTFENIFDNTLGPSCAVGSSCHSGAGDQGGLTLDSAQGAYDELLGKAGDDARVLPGDAGCSDLIVRLMSDGDDAMPPGTPLSEAERCAIIQWVSNGAER